MPQGKTGKIIGLDVLRTIAISLVVYLHLFHVCPVLPLWILETSKIGWIGVDLFFVLSGFLIGRQVFEIPGSGRWELIRNFWIKRWFRTLPLYYWVLVLYAGFKPLLGYPFIDGHWGFLVFTQNYMKLSDFVQSWSLCIEEQFYFVFPLLAFGLKLRVAPKWIWLVPLALSMAARAVLYRAGTVASPDPRIIDFHLRFLTHTHLDGISIGVFLAATFRFWFRIHHVTRRMIAALGCIIAFGTPYFTQYHLHGLWSIFGFTVISAGFGMMLVGFYSMRFPSWIEIPCSKIALWSYGIYLWNIVVVRVLSKVQGHSVLLAAVYLIGTVAVSALTYPLIEKTGLRIRDRVLERLSAQKVIA